VIEGLVAGKVYGRPEQRTSNSTGKVFTVAKVRAATSGGETLFVNVLAFDATAQAALLALSEGDAVSLAGTLTPKVWVDRENQPRPALDLIASQVLTAYQAKRKREAATGAEQPLRQARVATQQEDYRSPASAPAAPPAAAAATDADGWPASDAPWNDETP
jgi:single-stranded DNA-binding protein